MRKRFLYLGLCIALTAQTSFFYAQTQKATAASGSKSSADYTIEDFLREGFTEEEIENARISAAASANVSPQDATMTSKSHIDWKKNQFVSDVSLDVVKARIPMPSGKSLSLNRIKMELPVLIKDPLLSIYVDDTKKLEDLVLEGTITLESLTRIIDNSRQTPPYFVDASSQLMTTHTINLHDISALLVRHKTPYTQEKPIDSIASRAYTGIVIDARGLLPVQGEPQVSSQVVPCMFPRIWNEDMTLVYERNMVLPDVAKKDGIVDYLNIRTPSKKTERAGRDPLWISAKKVYGVNRCDPVISYDDYLRIATVPANLELLKQGKVVILLDEETLSGTVKAPQKDIRYWLDYTEAKKRLDQNKVPDVTITPSSSGTVYLMENLRFIADSSELLPQERPRVHEIAEQIKEQLKNKYIGYTIRIDGHTADINQPENQQTLSVQRAEAIVNALVAEGISRDIFTWYGYGGTKPVADNATEEGRAKNRRVEITVQPKSTEIRRR